MSRERPLVSVLGSGSWGTTLAQLIASNGHDVHLWGRAGSTAVEINRKHTNRQYLGNARLSRRLKATDDLARAVDRVPLLLLVVPAKAFRQLCGLLGPLVTPDQWVVHATKGFEAETHYRMSEILVQETCIRQFGVLSGPNIAPEIVAGKPAGTTIASRFPEVVREASRLLKSDRFRVYSSADVVGTELAGALKNIVAIAAGIAAQFDLGENAKALLITRGLGEIARLGMALGANPVSFSGVAGVGDLIVTCTSPLSRNHRVGAALARGEKLEQIVADLGMVAEGVNTCLTAHRLVARLGIDAPLLHAVYRIVHEGLSPREALGQLMSLESRPDVAWA